MNQPLRGHRVVICRSHAQSETLVTAAVAAGAEPVLVPLLEVADPADGGGALRDALATLDRYDWVTFTSTNSVRAVLEIRRDGWGDHPRIAAVGPRTAQVLTTFGCPVHFVSHAATAQDLAQTLPIEQGDVVLVPLGNRADNQLVGTLRARGATVDRVEAYRTLWADVSPAQVAAATEAHAVLLTSASIARRFGELIPEGGPPAICIGPSTAAAARDVGMNVVGTAYEPTPTALIEAVVRNLS